MSVNLQPGLNGRLKKSLAHQLDRLDTILDGLAEALHGAVADAVKQAVGQAAKEAVQVALAEAMKQEPKEKPVPAPRPNPLTGGRLLMQQAMRRISQWMLGAAGRVKKAVSTATVPVVLATQSCWTAVRKRSINIAILLGAVTSCVMGLFRKDARKIWWGAGVIASTIMLESCLGTLGTLSLGAGVVYLVLQSRSNQLIAPRNAPAMG
jgi:hypothetical protein